MLVRLWSLYGRANVPTNLFAKYNFTRTKKFDITSKFLENKRKLFQDAQFTSVVGFFEGESVVGFWVGETVGSSLVGETLGSSEVGESEG